MDYNRLSFYLYRFPQLTKFEKSKVMEKQKTAVGFLMMVLQEEFPKQMRDIYESNQLLAEQIAIQAKYMEKEQIVEAWYNGSSDGATVCTQHSDLPAEQYYESKYGKDENKAENND